MAAQTFKIAAIPADGVGKEVVAAGRRVVDTPTSPAKGSATRSERSSAPR